MGKVNKKKVKRQPKDWEIDLQVICLVRGLQLELLQFYNKRQESKLKMGNTINRYFSKEGIQMANMLLKRCSTSLANRKMQIKNTVRYHFRHITLIVIRGRHKTISFGEDMEKLKLLHIVVGNIQWCYCFRKQFFNSSKC